MQQSQFSVENVGFASVCECVSSFDEHQQKAIFRMMSRILNVFHHKDDSVVKLDAPGGFGKTHLLRKVCHILDKIATRYRVSTFTGRAASQVSKDGLSNVSTLHSLLLDAFLDENGDLIRFDEKPDHVVAASIGSVLFCDEASMIPSAMFTRMKNICQAYDIVFVVIGDQAQLPSIEPPNVGNFDLLRRTDVEFASLYLRQNYRQLEGSAIADLCMHLREVNSIPRRKADDLRMVLKSKVMTLDFHTKNRFDVIICGTHKTRQRINQLVRRAREHFDEHPSEGEIVICKRNDVVASQKINNGELYEVVSSFPAPINECRTYLLKCLDKNLTIRVNIPDRCWDGDMNFGRKIAGTSVQQFDFGYCITCHSAQGSQFDNLLYIDEDVSYFIDQMRFRYTAVSRARRKLTIAM